MSSKPNENSHTASGQLSVWTERAHIDICHIGIADFLNAGRILFIARQVGDVKEKDAHKKSCLSTV